MPQEKCGPTSTYITKVWGSPVYPFPTTHDNREGPTENQKSHPHPALKSLPLICGVSGDHSGDHKSNNETLLPSLLGWYQQKLIVELELSLTPPVTTNTPPNPSGVNRDWNETWSLPIPAEYRYLLAPLLLPEFCQRKLTKTESLNRI